MNLQQSRKRCLEETVTNSITSELVLTKMTTKAQEESSSQERCVRRKCDVNNEGATEKEIIKTPSEEKATLVAELPDPKSDVDPDTYLMQLIEAQCGYRPVGKQALSLENFFDERTAEQLAAYDTNVIAAARENEVGKIRSLYNDDGQALDCCNRYGESLLHLACRRGFQEMTEFLLVEGSGPKLSVRICDDYGRTPFHDACWNTEPQLKICTWLLQREPTLLLLTDKRGATPFQYARQQHWNQWKQFLYDNRTCFNVMKEQHLIDRFS